VRCIKCKNRSRVNSRRSPYSLL